MLKSISKAAPLVGQLKSVVEAWAAEKAAGGRLEAADATELIEFLQGQEHRLLKAVTDAVMLSPAPSAISNLYSGDPKVLSSMLIRWGPGGYSPCHDHGDADACSVHVLRGAIRECKMVPLNPHEAAGDGVMVRRQERILMEGDTITNDPCIHIMNNTFNEAAVTLHSYVPPLRKGNDYILEDSGILWRDRRWTEK